MSPLRRVGLAALVATVVLAGAACGSDDDGGATSGRAPAVFADPPEGANSIGVCRSFDTATIKEQVGGGSNFRRLAPTAIGKAGDAVTGESCSWERQDPGGAFRTLTITVRNFGADAAALGDAFESRTSSLVDAEELPGLGDAAVTSASAEATEVFVNQGPYELQVASRAGEGLDPLPVETLVFLATAGLEVLP